jgi:hypothetical protein
MNNRHKNKIIFHFDSQSGLYSEFLRISTFVSKTDRSSHHPFNTYRIDRTMSFMMSICHEKDFINL